MIVKSEFYYTPSAKVRCRCSTLNSHSPTSVPGEFDKFTEPLQFSRNRTAAKQLSFARDIK